MSLKKIATANGKPCSLVFIEEMEAIKRECHLFECSCGKKFMTQYYAAYHVKKAHNGEKPEDKLKFTCNLSLSLSTLEKLYISVTDNIQSYLKSDTSGKRANTDADQNDDGQPAKKKPLVDASTVTNSVLQDSNKDVTKKRPTSIPSDFSVHSSTPNSSPITAMNRSTAPSESSLELESNYNCVTVSFEVDNPRLNDPRVATKSVDSVYNKYYNLKREIPVPRKLVDAFRERNGARDGTTEKWPNESVDVSSSPSDMSEIKSPEQYAQKQEAVPDKVVIHQRSSVQPDWKSVESSMIFTQKVSMEQASRDTVVVPVIELIDEVPNRKETVDNGSEQPNVVLEKPSCDKENASNCGEVHNNEDVIHNLAEALLSKLLANGQGEKVSQISRIEHGDASHVFDQKNEKCAMLPVNFESQSDGYKEKINEPSFLDLASQETANTASDIVHNKQVVQIAESSNQGQHFSDSHLNEQQEELTENAVSLLTCTDDH